MKKLFVIILCFCLLFLNGCIDFNNETSTQTTEEEIIGSITVHDIALYYEFSATSFEVYTFSDSTTKYVNIEAFLDLIDEALISLNLDDEENSLTVSHEYGILYPNHSFDIVFDSEENTVYINDFDYLAYINHQSSLEYETELMMVDYGYFEGELEVTIDLDDYNLDIVKEFSDYYIPLSLANILLTGQNINVYLDNDDIYIFDDYEEALEYFNSDSIDLTESEADLIQETVNITALFFDHFYGLKDILEIDSFVSLLDSYGMYEAPSIEALDVLLQTFIYDLDDLHTSVLDYGSYQGNIESVYPDEESRYVDVFTNLYRALTPERDYEIHFYEEPTYYYLDILEFNFDTKAYLDEVLVDLDPDKPIYIDVSCNTGGSLIAVLELVAYMTNQPIALNYYSQATNTQNEEVYQSTTQKALENQFIVLTSSVTYSAASLFAYFVEANDLGLLVGTDTSGGACAVLLNVLPNNMVIAYSSQMIISDASYNDIEYGVGATVSFETITNDISSIDSYLKTKFYDNAEFYYDVLLEEGVTVTIDGSISYKNNDLEFNRFSVFTYDLETGELMDRYITSTSSLTYSYPFNEETDQLNIRVYCEYVLDDVTYTTLIVDEYLG